MNKTKFIFISIFSILIFSAFASTSMAAGELSAVRYIEPLSVEPGENIQVTVVITSVSEEIAGITLSEELPENWAITSIDNDGLLFDGGDEWLLISGSMPPGSEKTIIYEVKVPEESSGRSYSISGEVAGKNITVYPLIKYTAEVTGDSQVTVEGRMVFTNTDWTQFQTNTYNNGITSDRAAIQKPDDSESWSTHTYHLKDSYGIDVQPLVVGDLAYVVAYDAVYAINRLDGDIEWTQQIEAGVTTPLGTPAYGNGKLFVVSFGNVYAYDAITGEELWNRTISSENLFITQLNTPVTYDNGRIYFGEWLASGDEKPKYYCYDESGNEVWSRASSTNKGYYYAGAAIVGNYLIYGDDALHITSVNKYDGSIVDEINVSALMGFGYNGEREEIRSSITYSPEAGRIYSSSEAGYCFYIGLRSNGKFNKADTGKVYIGKSTSTPTVHNGRVYVGTGTFAGSGEVYCLDESDLSVIWSYTPNGGVQASPVISTAYESINGDIYLYFTTNVENGRVYCLKDYPGNTEPDLQWYYEPPEGQNQYTLHGVAIKDGTIYYGNDAGYLFGLAEWNPWDDPYSDSGGIVNSDELQEAIHCWLTLERAPVTGALIDSDRLQVMIRLWLTQNNGTVIGQI